MIHVVVPSLLFSTRDLDLSLRFSSVATAQEMLEERGVIANLIKPVQYLFVQLPDNHQQDIDFIPDGFV